MSAETTTDTGDTSSSVSSSETLNVDLDAIAEPASETPEAEAKEGEEGKPTKEPTAEEKKAAVRAKQIAALMKQESALRRQNAELERKSKELEEHYSSRVEALRGEFEKIETFKAQARDYLSRAKEDPIGWLQEEFGIGPEEYYARFMNDGKPAKDEVHNDRFRQLESRYEALQRRLEEKEAAEAEARQKWREQQDARLEEQRKQQAQQAVAEAQEEFWTTVTSSKEFAALNYESDGERLYPREVLLKAATELVQELGPEAQKMSYTDLARQMNESAEAWLKKFKGQLPSDSEPEPAKPAAVSKKASSSSSPAEIVKVRRAAGEHGNPIQTTKTLSSELSSSKASSRVGRTHQEEKEALKRELAGLSR